MGVRRLSKLVSPAYAAEAAAVDKACAAAFAPACKLIQAIADRAEMCAPAVYVAEEVACNRHHRRQGGPTGRSRTPRGPALEL